MRDKRELEVSVARSNGRAENVSGFHLGSVKVRDTRDCDYKDHFP